MKPPPPNNDLALAIDQRSLAQSMLFFYCLRIHPKRHYKAHNQPTILVLLIHKA